jgi:tRNA A-37 threonylcarbamoyl transferase component Bud32
MTQETSGPDPLVGMFVANKYRIVALLGEGGMGAVYRAEQQLGTTTRKVALKTLHKHLSHDASIKARFDREAGLVAGLEHPNTIQVFDFGAMDDGTLYLVMEYVEGRSVGDILEKDGPMNPVRVDNILRQVCGSLEEAHGKGIVHRDLKPDNVVLCERAGQKDWVEVLDFGIAKRSSEHDPNEAKLTQQGMVLGTPPYMSPEQFTGQPIDARSDIYALGVMAYEMLTGRLPWQANTAWEWASKHMTEAPTPLDQQPLGPHVPPNQRAAIERALAKNKDERFGSVKEFYEAFSAKGHVAAAAPAAAMGRAKTEIGAPMPMMAPTPPGAMPTPAPFPSVPGYGPAPGTGGPMASSAIAPGPMHAPQAKKGPGGLVIGLGALAVLLLVGGGIAAVAGGKKKGAATTTLDLTPTSTSVTSAADAGAADTPVADPGATSVAPLGAASGPAPVAQGGGAKPVAKADAGIPRPVPQGGATNNIPAPQPQKPPAAEPAVCGQYRTMKADPKSRPAMLASLEAQCRKAGGTP